MSVTQGGSHLDAHGPLSDRRRGCLGLHRSDRHCRSGAGAARSFGECQAGQCSCPTDEYQKLASMDVQHTGDLIRIRLEPKAGQVLNTRQIAACLDYTTTTASDAMDDEQRGPK